MPDTNTKSVKIDEELHRRLRMIAADHGCKLHTLTEALLSHALDGDKKILEALITKACPEP